MRIHLTHIIYTDVFILRYILMFYSQLDISVFYDDSAYLPGTHIVNYSGIGGSVKESPGFIVVNTAPDVD